MFAGNISGAESGRDNCSVAGIWRAIAFIALLLVCLIPSMASAQTNQYTNATTGGIVDSTTCATTVTRTFSVGTSFIVSDVDLGVFLTHTYRGDLRITLQSPTGTIVNIMTNTGGDGDNLSDLFNDEAAAGIATHNATAIDPTTTPPPYSHSFQPTSVLSSFDGQNALGTWTLVICDSVAQDTGTFSRADLYITQQSPFADLSLTKTVSNAAPANGATISYTLTASSAAASSLTATGVTVLDNLPPGVSFVSASGTGSYNSTSGIWTIGTLAPGASASITITVSVSATSGATITNEAEIASSSAFDADSTPNNGSVTEDDDASVSFTISGTRTAGTPPTLTCPVGTTVFDWDGRTWATGSLSNSYTLTNVGIFNIGISSSISFVAGSPALNGNLTGGLSPIQNSLFLNMNNTSLAQTSTAVIALPTAVPAMQFRLHDVDFGSGTFADKVTVTGSFNGNNVFPALTNGVANYVIGNVVIGDAGATDTTSLGNVVVTFLSPVDTITIIYGNHTTAPADPGNQWMSIHDISFCNPQATLSVTKISSVLTDGTSVTNPKAVPGATVRYCITVTNNGSGTATTVSASDVVPVRVTYVPGSMTTGASCGSASTAEDDNNIGADESDPYGMAIAGTTVTGGAVSLAPNASVALVFLATVN